MLTVSKLEPSNPSNQLVCILSKESVNLKLATVKSGCTCSIYKMKQKIVFIPLLLVHLGCNIKVSKNFKKINLLLFGIEAVSQILIGVI